MRPTGSPLSPILIINDQPTKKDRLTGRPFSDGCGVTLSQLLSSNGLSLRDCYLTTFPIGVYTTPIVLTKKETPKKEDYLYSYQKGGINYNHNFGFEQVELKKLVDESDCKIIICTGNASLFALTGKWGISKYRGSIIPYKDKKIIPTVHPMSIYRQSILYYYALNDIKKVYTELNNYEQTDLYTPNLLIAPSLAESLSYLEQCYESKKVAFDIETVRTRKVKKFVDWEMSCFSISKAEGEALCITFLDNKGNNVWKPEEELLIFRALDKILHSEDTVKVIQNAMFDASFLLHKHKMHIRNIEDTMIAQAIITPDFDKNLGFLCSLYTRTMYHKDDGKQHLKQGGDNWTRFLRYSAMDSAVLLEINRKQLDVLTKFNNMETYKAHCDLIQPLLFMSSQGIRIDKDLLEITSKALKSNELSVLRKICELVGEEINPNSTIQLQAYFYGRLRLKKVMKDGRPTLDEKALKHIAAETGNPVANLILELRKMSKLRSTYMDVTVDEDQRLRTSFNPVGTISGRLSSNKTIFNTGGNFQNQPPAFKARLLADDNYFIVNVDLAQAENRLVANFGPDHTMLEAFANGVSLHSQTGAVLASAMLGSKIDWTEIERDNKLLEKAEENGQDITPYIAPIGPGNKSWRHWGKTSNHALNYDLSAKGFAERMEIPLKDAEWIKKVYLQTYPGVRTYQEMIKHEIRTIHYLTNPFGRKIRLLGNKGDDLFRQGYSMLPQSTVADIINRFGLIPLYQEQEKYKPFFLLSQVHDSIVFQVSKKYSAAHVQSSLIKLKESLETPIPYRCREIIIPADFKAGYTMGKMKGIDVHNLEDIENFYG